MSEAERTKSLKRRMSICTILQTKFGCRCNKEGKLPFCEAVEEIDKI